MKAIQPGDRYVWTGDLTASIEVLKVGRRYAEIRVVQASGASWVKKQPLPFPESFWPAPEPTP